MIDKYIYDVWYYMYYESIKLNTNDLEIPSNKTVNTCSLVRVIALMYAIHMCIWLMFYNITMKIYSKMNMK